MGEWRSAPSIVSFVSVCLCVWVYVCVREGLPSIPASRSFFILPFLFLKKKSPFFLIPNFVKNSVLLQSRRPFFFFVEC